MKQPLWGEGLAEWEGNWLRDPEHRAAFYRGLIPEEEHWESEGLTREEAQRFRLKFGELRRVSWEIRERASAEEYNRGG